MSCDTISCAGENFILPEGFLQSQIDEYKRSGRFIDHIAILPSNGWPESLQDVISLVDLLQLYAGVKVEYVVKVSKATQRRLFYIDLVS